MRQSEKQAQELSKLLDELASEVRNTFGFRQGIRHSLKTQEFDQDFIDALNLDCVTFSLYRSTPFSDDILFLEIAVPNHGPHSQQQETLLAVAAVRSRGPLLRPIGRFTMQNAKYLDNWLLAYAKEKDVDIYSGVPPETGARKAAKQTSLHPCHPKFSPVSTKPPGASSIAY